MSNYVPAVGERVQITAICGKLGIKVGDIVEVIEYDQGAVLFQKGVNRVWTDSYAQMKQDFVPALLPAGEYLLPKSMVNKISGNLDKINSEAKKCVCSMNDLLAYGCKCGGE